MDSTRFALSCPAPLGDGERILLAHGEGARMTRRLIRQELLAAFDNPYLRQLADGATLPDLGSRLVMTTDSSVVSPLFFPGGDIGMLAIHGAINDISVCGATPSYLSVALVLEEGLPMETFRRVIRSMRDASRACGVSIVTGDTKVVPRGVADQIFICTTGIGRLQTGVDLGAHRVQPGDKILVSGAIGDHGLAILGARNAFDFGDQLASDTAPLHDLVASLLSASADVHFMRDPTRGGVAAVLHELAEQSGLTIRLEEAALPVSPAVRGACELLGLDPIHIANEGKLIAVVAAEDADLVLATMQQHPLGTKAAVIGEVTAIAPPQVLLTNRFGQLHVLDEPSGSPLPRIC